MTLVSPELKEGVRRLLDRLKEDSASSSGPTTVVTKMIGPQSSEAKWPNFTLKSDEPKSVGGGESAPTPSSIFVASIGFAENVIFARQAALHNVDFDSLETRVEARWNRRGMFGIGEDSDPSITNVFIETKVNTNAPPQIIAELVKLTHKRSPMTATIAKAAIVQRKLFVNGEETRL